MGKKPYYLTTPIYYPSDNLHLGHTYTTIVADILKRYKTLQGYDVFFTTGTDEHGLKLLEAAQKAGKEPLEFIDPIVESAKELWETLDIEYDAFVRSTDPIHKKNVQNLFTKLYEKGDIYKANYVGNYCTPCESFWSDAQLEDGNCPDCGRPTHEHEEESYFFRLSKYREDLLKLYEDNPEFLQPESRKNEMINNFLKEELDDLSVSRKSLDWGVKVPFDEEHTIYVWIDALICYLTGIGYGTDDELFEKYWPADVHLVGKEIVRFHSIIWPAVLMAADLPLPKQIFGHGWILFDADKMSKSKGNIMYAEPIIDLYGMDVLRYFLMREFRFGSDGDFTKEKLLQRINSDLANDLGNLVSRTVSMVEQYFDGTIPGIGKEEDIDEEVRELLRGIAPKSEDKMDNFDFSQALEEIWIGIRRLNRYIDQTEPWILGREKEEERLSTVLYTLCDGLRIIATLISPFMRETAQEIQKQIGFENLDYEEAKETKILKAGTKVAKGNALFPRLDLEKELERLENANNDLIEARRIVPVEGEKAEEEKVEEEKISFDDFAKLDLRTAKVIEAKAHPNADRLLVLQIDLGDEKRQIVAGLSEHYKPEELIGKSIIIVANLLPVNLRGEESNGMLLAAEDENGLSLLTTIEEVKAGSVVS